MKKLRTNKLVLVFTLFMGLIVLLPFQNCADNQFDLNDDSLVGVFGSRSVSLKPNSFENRPTVQVTTILDNSHSMEPIQANLRGAFENVTGSLRGFDGIMTLYSTDQGPKDEVNNSTDKASVQSTEKISYTDTDGLTEEFLLGVFEVPEADSYVKLVKYELPKPFTPNAEPLPFYALMDDSEFNEFTNQYLTAIESLGSNGSDREQGLCTLMRAIDSASEDGVFHAYVIATNEADASEGIHCPLKTLTPITKAQAYEPGSTACDASDPECRFSYSLKWPTFYKEALSYKERKVSKRTSYYTTVRNAPSLKASVTWRTHNESLSFKIHRMTTKLKFKKYINRDDVIETAPDYNPQIDRISEYRKCTPTETERTSCNQSEIDFLIQNKDSYGANFGIDVSTCVHSCVDSQIQATNISLASNKIGNCSRSTEATCSSADLNTIDDRGVNSAAYVTDSCRYSCSEKDKNVNNFTLAAPGSCPATSSTSGVTATSCQSSNKTKKDLVDFLKSKDYDSNLHASDLTKCSKTCTQSYKGSFPSLKASSDFTCPDKGEWDSGTWSISCSDEQVQDLKDEGINVFPDTCKNTCRHTLKSRTKVIASKTSCNPDLDGDLYTSLLTNPLATSALDNIGDLPTPNTSYRIITNSHKYQCDALNQTTCTLAGKSDADLCNSDLNSLETACNLQKPGNGSLQANSCQVSTGSKTAVDVPNGYSEVVGSTERVDVFPPDSNVIEVVQNALRSRHDGQFFLSIFGPDVDYVVDRETKDECKPSDTNDVPTLDAARYKALTEQLGPNKAKFTPVCKQDFSDALKFTFELITQEMEGAYKLLLLDNEFIFEIIIIFEDGTSEIAEQGSYTWSKGILRFNDSELLRDVTDLRVNLGTFPKGQSNSDEE